MHTTKIPQEDPQRERKRTKMGARGRKKSDILGGLAERGPGWKWSRRWRECGPTLAEFKSTAGAQASLAEIFLVKLFLAKLGLTKLGLGQSWVRAKVGLITCERVVLGKSAKVLIGESAQGICPPHRGR